MNLEVAWGFFCDVGKAVYSAGLLAIGVQMLRAQPGMQRAARTFAGALTEHAKALHASAIEGEKLDRIAADVAVIRKSRRVVCRRCQTNARRALRRTRRPADAREVHA